jgi:hypothetical protein
MAKLDVTLPAGLTPIEGRILGYGHAECLCCTRPGDREGLFLAFSDGNMFVCFNHLRMTTKVRAQLAAQNGNGQADDESRDGASLFDRATL